MIMADEGDSLSKYREKRDFTKTREPAGVVAKTTGNRFLIQKHAATRLHYDFRLELDGVLKSWAVTRGPSYNPNDKRLAVEVEDHPVDYGHFEGTIPKGEYGGGTVMLWDEGTWEPIGDPHEGLKTGDFKFIVHGTRLQGSWVLARMKPRPQDRGRNNWLLIKHRDETSNDEDAEAWLEAHATSVVSGRTMEEIAADPGKEWSAGGEHQVAPQAKATPSRKASLAPSKTAKTKLPPLAFQDLELATLADAVPAGPEWVHEVKFDGYRTEALVDNGQVRLMTRKGLDWTHKYAEVARVLAALDARQAILDGEIVAVTEQGVSSFSKLKDELGAERSDNLQYYVFDLLALDGEDLTRLPLLERKSRLQTLLGRSTFEGRVIYSEHFTENPDFLPSACRLDMEGIISKRVDSVYSGRRGKTWLKIKCHKRQEFVIVGYTESTHAGRGFRSLLLGYYEEGALQFAGKVGTGFNAQSMDDIRDKLDAVPVIPKPFKKLPPDVGKGIWIEPKLVCEVEFTEWTPEGRLRHPSFQGLREDKAASSVGRDREAPVTAAVKAAEVEVKEASAETKPKAAAKSHRHPAANLRAVKSDRVDVGGIGVSHPDRVVFPADGITKLEIVQYYDAVSKHILPHLVGRPLSLVRVPDTIEGQQFFQRHLPEHGGLHNVSSIDVPLKGRVEDYMMIDGKLGLLSLAQWGGIEFHPWGCHADTPALPDRMIFDLDPDPGSPWSAVIEAAAEVRDRMKELGLQSFLKTTGGKGLHVVIPIERKFSWPAIKAFTRAIAESMEHDNPSHFIATMSKAKRSGKIFVDYLRNDHTATAACAFSVRARPGATVSTPLDWSELKTSLDPKAFDIHTLPKRLKSEATDPWQDFFAVKQGLQQAILEALHIKPL